ncbi:unnamed protein product [Moneuplotes crassus]|uniref:Uncharacterized protein n=1 Tax=Euplotes crassus TaxID=5936 RepID=A0AAD1UUN7_EUPCR|nr:unnamed protein product [Moneuplotes crassus]
MIAYLLSPLILFRVMFIFLRPQEATKCVKYSISSISWLFISLLAMFRISRDLFLGKASKILWSPLTFIELKDRFILLQAFLALRNLCIPSLQFLVISFRLRLMSCNTECRLMLSRILDAPLLPKQFPLRSSDMSAFRFLRALDSFGQISGPRRFPLRSKNWMYLRSPKFFSMISAWLLVMDTFDNQSFRKESLPLFKILSPQNFCHCLSGTQWERNLGFQLILKISIVLILLKCSSKSPNGKWISVISTLAAFLRMLVNILSNLLILGRPILGGSSLFSSFSLFSSLSIYQRL